MSEQRLWLDFLGERFGCYPDGVGNMPCDNGCTCSRCCNSKAEFEQYKKAKGETV